jgi:hypothetical protein
MIDVRGGGAIATGPVVRRAVRAGAILVAYVAATVAITWPLAARLSTHLPAAAGPLHIDQYYLGWALAWQTHALVTSPAQLANANIYWPAPHALFYGTPGFALLPIFAPVFLATGDVTTSFDVTLLVSWALTAVALHWATGRITGSTTAAIAAAGTYLTATMPLGWCELVPQYSAHFAMPLVMAAIVAVPRTRRRILELAALVAFQGLADVVYVALPFMVLTSLAGRVTLGRDPATRDGARGVRRALCRALAALLPVYAAYALVAWRNPDLRRQTVWGPTQLAYVGGGLLPGHGPLAVGYTLCLLIAVGLWLHRRDSTSPAERRAWWCAGTYAVVGLVVSWTIPSLAPGFLDLLATYVVRDPLRLGLAGLTAVCLLAGLAFAAGGRALAARVPSSARRWVSGTLLLAYLASRLALATWPLGSHPLEPAPALGSEEEALRAGSGPVLVLPLGDQFERGVHAAAMYRTATLWRPLLNGYSSYYPEGFRERMALARRLPDGQAFEQLRALGLATIVVYSSGFEQLVRQPWRRAIDEGRLGAIAVRLDNPDVLVIDLVGAPPSR